MTTLAPSARLAPFIRTFTIVEAPEDTTRLLVPDTSLVLGFRYSGYAQHLENGLAIRLPDATFVGVRNSARRMRTSAGGGAILTMFREGGAAQFFAEPLHELFGATLALDELIPHRDVDRVASRVANATRDAERAAIVEEFLIARRATQDPDPPDRLVAAAVRAIRDARGSIRIRALAADLGISQNRLEKRFRCVVGTSPKQLASLVRLHHAIGSYRPGVNLAKVSADAGYFDQAHFTREFRAVMGDAPQRLLSAGNQCFRQAVSL